MPDIESIVPLSKLLLSSDGKTVSNTFISIILEEDLPVVCINKEMGKKRKISFRILYENNNSFWQKGGNWEYYITAEHLKVIEEKAVSKSGSWEKMPAGGVQTVKKPELKRDVEDLEEVEVEAGYGSDYEKFSKMSTTEKISCLNSNKQKLSDLITSKRKDKEVITEALVDTTKDAALINHAVLADALRLGDDEDKKLTQYLVDSTHEMVKSSTQLITADIFNNDLMSTLVEKSNGTIVQHMTRVYLNGIAFLAYYNNLVSTSSTIQKLRITFSAKYGAFYHDLLPHININHINLERVFYGGMRAIPPDLYFKWAVGFLIHDIGKAAAVEYHEGEASYDRNIVIDHVKQGYKSILSKTNYPMEASLITGYHHEYYGDPAGYGYFRAYLQQHKKQNPDARQDFCITYDLAPLLEYQALAYFPAKVLEIIDVYDSVTDPHRVYRKAMTPTEALDMMKAEFVEKHRKIDIILFDIFSNFIMEQEQKRLLKTL
jgi:hypothetical protein